LLDSLLQEKLDKSEADREPGVSFQIPWPRDRNRLNNLFK